MAVTVDRTGMIPDLCSDVLEHQAAARERRRKSGEYLTGMLDRAVGSCLAVGVPEDVIYQVVADRFTAELATDPTSPPRLRLVG